MSRNLGVIHNEVFSPLHHFFPLLCFDFALLWPSFLHFINGCHLWLPDPLLPFTPLLPQHLIAHVQ